MNNGPKMSYHMGGMESENTALKAENAKLRAEVEKMTGVFEKWRRCAEIGACDRCEKAETKCTELRAENEKLKALLAGINPRVDAADFEQLAEIGRGILESRTRMEEIMARVAAGEKE